MKAPRPVRLNLLEFACLDYFDGANTVREIHQAVLKEKGVANYYRGKGIEAREGQVEKK